MNSKGIIGIFSTDWQMADAIRRLREKNIPVTDAFTPFISHDIMNQLGRESRLPYISVAAGAGTIIMVLAFLYYTAVIDYPLIYGGKPYFAFPSFVVVIYLLTILITFILTVAAFQARTGIIPGKVITEPIHRAGADEFIEGLTDDKFMIILGGREGLSVDMKESASAILKESGSTEIIEIKS
jgi:hypothetical protein